MKLWTDSLPTILKEELSFEQAKIRLAELKLATLGNIFVDKYFAYDKLVDGEPALTQRINIVVHEDIEKKFLLSPELFNLFRQYDVHGYAYYLDDLDTAKYAYDAIVDVPFIAL